MSDVWVENVSFDLDEIAKIQILLSKDLNEWVELLNTPGLVISTCEICMKHIDCIDRIIKKLDLED